MLQVPTTHNIVGSTLRTEDLAQKALPTLKADYAACVRNLSPCTIARQQGGQLSQRELLTSAKLQRANDIWQEIVRRNSKS